MTQPTLFRIAFLNLLAGIFAMRIYFMLKVRHAGERVMPDKVVRVPKEEYMLLEAFGE
jgi:hypothetical protein